MTSRRPLTPLGMVIAPLAFCLYVGGRFFDAVFPEKTKYKYRVADRTDAENKPLDGNKIEEKV